VAGMDRMTIAEVVREVLRDEHADVIGESVRAVAQELMEAEVSELIGAERGERSEDRATHRNGYRPRRWDTRAGEIELQIPKIRQGSYFPSFLQPRKRSEQALVSVVQQAYVCGVSTRRVDQLVESLGLRISKSEVSRIAGLLDDQVQAFPPAAVGGPLSLCVRRREDREGPRRRPRRQKVRRDRPRRARDRPQGDHRLGRRRSGDRGVLDGVSAVARRAWPGRGAAGDQ
jgi:mutator family transposase